MKKQDNSLKYIYPILIFVATLFMGVGYARVNDQTLLISGKLETNLPKEVLITSVDYSSNASADVDNSKINYFAGTLLDSEIVLGNNGYSTITYNISVYNNSNSDQVFIETITDLLDPDLYSNPNIEFSLSGIEEYQTVLAPKDSLTFQITFSYKNNTVAADHVLVSKLNFRFKEVPKIFLSNENTTSTVSDAYPGNPKKYSFNVSNYNDSEINSVPLKYSFETTMNAPFTLKVVDEGDNEVTNKVELEGDSQTTEKHNYKFVVDWENIDDNFDYSQYEGKEFNGQVILKAIPEDSEKYLDYVIIKKFNVKVALHWTDQLAPVVTIKATKVSSGTEAVNDRWSKEGLNFTFNVSQVGSSGATIYYCKDTTNTCNPNIVATPGTKITTYNNLIQDRYYIRYKAINGQGVTSGTKTFIAKVNYLAICTIDSNSSVKGLKQAAKFNCKVDPNREEYTFYVLTTPSSGATTVDLIMDSNIRKNGNPIKETNPTDLNEIRFEWLKEDDFVSLGGTKEEFSSNGNSYGPITAMNYLEVATSNWTNLDTMTVDSFNACYKDSNRNIICDKTGLKMKKSYQVYARLPYISEITVLNSKSSSLWIRDYLQQYESLAQNPVNGVHGYWTLSAHSTELTRAWHGYNRGYVDRWDIYNDGSYGVRPVITIPTERISY